MFPSVPTLAQVPALYFPKTASLLAPHLAFRAFCAAASFSFFPSQVTIAVYCKRENKGTRIAHKNGLLVKSKEVKVYWMNTTRNRSHLLQSLSVREWHMPRQSGVNLVHLAEVNSGCLLVIHIQRHLSWQEEDSRHGWGDSTLQGSDGEGGNLLGGGSRSLEAVLDHVGLKDGSLEVDVVVSEGLELSGENLFGGSCPMMNKPKYQFCVSGKSSIRSYCILKSVLH